MSESDPIYVDPSQPATLHDGAVSTDCPTLGEAKIAWDRLPPARQQMATISSGGTVYTVKEIPRLYSAPAPNLTTGFFDAASLIRDVHDVARRNLASNASGPVEPILPLENQTMSVPPTPTGARTKCTAGPPM